MLLTFGANKFFIALILSILAFLLFRSSAYDSSIGGCLRAMHTSCPDDVVKLTAEDLVNIFHRSMWRTKSMELKVN